MATVQHNRITAVSILQIDNTKCVIKDGFAETVTYATSVFCGGT